MKRLILSVVAALATFVGVHAQTHNVLNFKKDSGAVSTSVPIVTTKDSLTISVWAKLDINSMSALDTRYPYGPIFTQTGNAADYVFAYLRGKGKLVFMRSNAWSATDAMKTIVDAPTDGGWHFLTAVYDRDAKKRSIYIDATLIQQDDDTRDFAPNLTNVAFGYTPWGNNFRGALAEMSIWKKALTVAEIQTIMSKRPAGDDLNDCLAYWPMGEGDGGTASADIANGNSLTISNSKNSVLESTDDFPAFAFCSPDFAASQTLAYSAEGNTLSVSSTVTKPGAGTSLKVVLTDKDGQEAFSKSFATNVEDGGTYSTTVAGLAANTTYKVAVTAEDAVGFKVSSYGTVYSGDISIVAAGDVTKYGEDGVFTVSRADTAEAKAYDLVVTYTIGGTAVNGTDYKTLTGTVVIPAGESSAQMVLSQALGCAVDAVRTTILTVESGKAYLVSASAPAATISKTYYSVNHEKNVLDAVSSSTLTTGKRVISVNGTSYSLTGWIKLNKDSMTGTGSIIRQQGDNQYTFTLDYEKSTDQIVFSRRSGGWGYVENHKTRVSAPAHGEWHYITAIWDVSDMKRKIYIDGILKGEGVGTGTTAPNPNLTIAPSFLGGMAEMSVWSKALSTAEIESLMWNRPTDFTDCLAYWPFDEGEAATTARDISGNGTTVTIPDAKKAILRETTDFVDFKAGDTRIKYDVVVKYPTDRVSVAVSGTEMVGDQFVAGSEGTFVATGEGTFVGWSGDVPDALRANKSITMTIDATKIIAPVFSYDWVYDAKAKTISDGYWTLNTTLSGIELTITGVNTTTYKNTQGNPLMQLLDLRKPVADTNGVSYAVVVIDNGALANNPVVVNVRLPDTLRTLGGAWYDNGAFYNCTALTNVTPLVPAGLVRFGIAAFYNCTKLTGELVFGVAEGAYFGDGAYHGMQFQNTKITAVTLDKSIDLLPINVFNGCTAITTFSLEHRPTTIRSGAFSNWTEKKCRFLIDPNDANWAAYLADSANFTAWGALTAAVKEQYTKAFPGEKKPLGLSLTLPANQWLCNLKTPGMTIILR